MKTVFYLSVALKFLCGISLIFIGISNSDTGALFAGIGHSFLLTPLWAYVGK